MGAISGKGMRENMGLGKGVGVLGIILGALGSFGLGLATSRPFLGLFTETGFFVEIWG